MRRTLASNAGLALAVLSAGTFGTSGSFASSLIHAGWSPGAAVIARVVIAAALLSVPALLQLRRQPGVSAGSLRKVGLYGVAAVAGAQLCYFNAVAHLSVAVALLLEYSGILLVVGYGWARHGHRPRRPTIGGGVLCLAGLVLVLNLIGSHHVDIAGVLWGLGAAVGLAVYFVLASDATDALPPLVVAWAGLVVGAAVLGIAAAVGALPVHAVRANVILAHQPVSWIWPVIGLSVVAGVIAYLSGIVAARALGAKLASFLGLAEVLFAVTFAWLLLDQRLSLIQLAGGALVVVGIALVRVDELREPAAHVLVTTGGGEPQLVAADLGSSA